MDAEIARFLDAYTPEMRKQFAAARARMRKLVPRGVELVYDNYNSLVFGYGPTERASDAVVSLAGFPKWVTLCFLRGVELKDPQELLKGGGNLVRHMRLTGPEDLDRAEVLELIGQALAQEGERFAAAGRLRTVVKSISAKQRPRRPVSG